MSGEVSRGNLVPSGDDFVCRTTWKFRYDDPADFIISFIVARSENESLVRFARVSLPLAWFPPDAVVRHTFPMRCQGPAADTGVALCLEVHRSENGQPPFLPPEGKLLVTLASDRSDGAKPVFPGMSAPGPPARRNAPRRPTDDAPEPDVAPNSGDLPRHDDAPQPADDLPRHDDAPQNSGALSRHDDALQPADDLPRHDDALQPADNIPHQDEAPRNSGDLPQWSGAYGMAPPGIPHPVPVRMPDGSIQMMIPVPFGYFPPPQATHGLYPPAFPWAMPWRP